MNATPVAPVIFAAAALLLASGCSTIVNHGRTAGVDVRSDPPGADVYLDGVPKGRTPLRVEIGGGSAEHAVRVEKPGYGTFERTVAKEMDPWVWGNATFAVFPIVAAAGFGIDAWCGQWYRVEPSKVDAKLSGAVAPASGTSVPQPAAVAAPVAPQPAAVAAPVASQPAPAADPPAPARDKTSDEMDELLKRVLDNN